MPMEWVRDRLFFGQRQVPPPASEPLICATATNLFSRNLTHLDWHDSFIFEHVIVV